MSLWPIWICQIQGHIESCFKGTKFSKELICSNIWLWSRPFFFLSPLTRACSQGLSLCLLPPLSPHLTDWRPRTTDLTLAAWARRPRPFYSSHQGSPLSVSLLLFSWCCGWGWSCHYSHWRLRSQTQMWPLRRHRTRQTLGAVPVLSLGWLWPGSCKRNFLTYWLSSVECCIGVWGHSPN